MAASDRVVYGRGFRVTPVWMWLAQRFSGVLLGPLVLMHMWSEDMAANRALNLVLLIFVLVHGYSGVRRLAVKKDRVMLTYALTLLWTALVAFFGVLIVLYHG